MEEVKQLGRIEKDQSRDIQFFGNTTCQVTWHLSHKLGKVRYHLPSWQVPAITFTGKSRYYTMSAIVKPLIDQGRLIMTMPDKPKSPKQRFVTVD